MRCRIDARLRHVCYFLPFRGVASDTRSVFFLFYWDFGRTTARLPLLYFPLCRFSFLLCIMIFAHVHHDCICYILCSTVCEYIQSTHWLVPGYCLGQMWTKAILWMKSSIASPTPRGVPVSPSRSWSLPLVLYTLPLPK
jgi:hypothetical protein